MANLTARNSSWFRTSGYLPSGRSLEGAIEAIDLANLPPFLRVLLTTDGTVTKSLEAYFWERVLVANVVQGVHSATERVESLDLGVGCLVLKRDVDLVGEQSSRTFVKANSLVNLAALPHKLGSALQSGHIGIGELIQDSGLETFREILDFGLNESEGAPSLWRRYRIVFGSKPVIQVTETFSNNHFR